jgi:hypothetical protein
MARSKLTNVSNDLITDIGGVLWSLIKAEQLEFPVTLSFLENASLGYTYEAVVIEALNVSGQTREQKPTAIKPDGVQTVLPLRIPTYRGNWDAAQAYNREELVLYSGKYYKLKSGVARTSAVLPSLDTAFWVETLANKIYIQYPSTLGSTWAVSPVGDSPVYGFFELRVTEPADAVYRRTWKPIRGMVEILFSPTELVPDV